MIRQWNRGGILEQEIRISGGHMKMPERAGLGNRLSADFLDRTDMLRRIIRT